MVTKKTTTRTLYKCDVCDSYFEKEEPAIKCEAKPIEDLRRFKHGDVALLAQPRSIVLIVGTKQLGHKLYEQIRFLDGDETHAGGLTLSSLDASVIEHLKNWLKVCDE